MTQPSPEETNTKQKNKGSERAIPVSIDSEDTRYEILTQLIKAEDYYVRKIQGARHSIIHEVMSDSSAIIGALTTLNFVYMKSLIAVSPIVGMLIWEGRQAKKDLQKLHRVAELFRKTRDPRYFHVLGLELEGIPPSENLTRAQRKELEADIDEILGKPVSFGATLKNLQKDQDNENDAESKVSFFRKGINGVKATGHFLWETIVDLKNLKTLPANYLKASFVLATQCKNVAISPVRPQFAKAAGKVKDWARIFRKKKEQEDQDATVAKVIRRQTATFATDPNALSREIKRVKESLRKAAIESTVNGVAFVCQTAFVVNQGLVTYDHMLHNEWAIAAGVAATSALALSPLNYFAKNQIDKHRQMNSKRADMARRLDDQTKTLKAVKLVNGFVKKIEKEDEEDKRMDMAKELVEMLGEDFNPNWFDEADKQHLKGLFAMVAANDNPAEDAAVEVTNDTEQAPEQRQSPAP